MSLSSILQLYARVVHFWILEEEYKSEIYWLFISAPLLGIRHTMSRLNRKMVKIYNLQFTIF